MVGKMEKGGLSYFSLFCLLARIRSLENERKREKKEKENLFIESLPWNGLDSSIATYLSGDSPEMALVGRGFVAWLVWASVQGLNPEEAELLTDSCFLVILNELGVSF